MSRIIKNSAQLGTTPERKKILAILEAGYNAIKTDSALKNTVKKQDNKLFVCGKKYDLRPYRRIHLIGIGKCALEAGQYFENLLGNRLSGGIILDTRAKKFKKLSSYAGDHPLPSSKNVRYTRAILSYIDSINPITDLLIFVISGGGSSLLCLPETITLKNYAALTLDLHKSGAGINKLNCIRKHLESIKGGKLARRIKPLQTIALYMSDVVLASKNQNLDIIASGPLVKDTATNARARQIIQEYGLRKKYPNIAVHLRETPKQAKDFSHIHNHIILTNATALRAMAQKAKKIGLSPKILDYSFTGPARLAFARTQKLARSHPGYNLFLVGGETMVRVTGKGKGGRNQEAVLAALLNLKPNEIFVSAASDGIDFTPHAGAIADKVTLNRMQSKSLNPRKFLEQNDSYTFFEKVKGFILTGKTGSNIADILIYYKI